MWCGSFPITSLRPGPAKILYQFDYDGGSPGAGGIARTPRGFFSIDETFDVGDDTGTAVGDGYPIPFKFNGELRSLTITLY
jgi:arylsulfatase